MNSGLAFWMPFIVIFGAGLIVSVVQRYARDICLLRFDGDYALIQMKSGNWIWGTLDVHSKALVVIYPEAMSGGEGEEHLTHILYEQNMADILLILRPEPAAGGTDYERWQREIERLRNPPPIRRLKRHLRNFFNMLRNAFSESIAAAIGIVKQRTAMGRIAGVDQKANEVGQKLLTSIPASYEPILEHYLSNEVTIETVKDLANAGAGIIERTGIFEEYSDKFLLIRDVFVRDGFPAQALTKEHARHRFAAILPRSTSTVRHLARRAMRPELVP